MTFMFQPLNPQGEKKTLVNTAQETVWAMSLYGINAWRNVCTAPWLNELSHFLNSNRFIPIFLSWTVYILHLLQFVSPYFIAGQHKNNPFTTCILYCIWYWNTSLIKRYNITKHTTTILLRNTLLAEFVFPVLSST
jgi:hypothetical protein